MMCTGTCFTEGDAQDAYLTDMEEYFWGGIQTYSALISQNNQITAWTNTYVKTSQFTDMYLHKVNIICDPRAALDNTTGKL